LKLSKVGEKITLLPSILRSRCQDPRLEDCTSYPTSPSQQCTILSPTTPIVPVVEFPSPSIIGSRDSFVFDLSASSGSGGRSWEKVSVFVSGYQGRFSNTKVIPVEKLNPLQELLGQSLSPKFVIPSSLLFSNSTYYFNITICNFLNVCSPPHIHSVFKESLPVPVISIYGSKERVIRRSDIVTISASAMLNTSNGIQSSSELNNGLTFKWEIFQGTLQVTVTSTSKDQTKFRIPSYSLDVGLSYNVRLTVTSLSPASSAMSSITVLVKQSGVIAVVNDGQQMYLLRQGQTLLLDASRSYDEDISGVKGSDAGLTFTWSCAATQTPVNCTSYFNLIFENNNALARVVDLGRSGDQIDWSITLTVASFASLPVRTNSVSILVRVVPPTAPTLFVTGPSQTRRESTLVLAGFVNSTTKVHAYWWSDTLPDLPTFLLTPSYVALSKGSNRVNLVIPRNTLSAGFSYLFHLSIENTTSSTSILVSVISAPRPGLLTIYPEIGIEYEDNFQLSALYWSDTELPLTYSYGFYAPSQVQYSLLTRTESTSLTTLLPKGNPKGNILHCFVIVYNNLNVSTRLNTSVVVNPASSERRLMVIDSIVSQASSITSRPLDDSEVGAIRQQIILGTSVVNSVNCSLMMNCASLNREACGEVSHQCGPCLSGFIEMDATDPYSACLTLDSVDSNDLSCSTSSDCSILQYCENNKCVYLPKSCPSGCSGRGVCRFEKISTGHSVDSCFADDVTCRALCECDPDFVGQICSTEISQLPQLQQNRYSLLNTLNYTFGYGEVSVDALNSLMSLLLDLSAVQDELSCESCSLLVSMVGKVLNMINDGDSDLNFEDVMPMFPIFNTCLSILSDDPAMTFYNLVMEKLVATISSTLVSGIGPQEMVQSSIRMTSVTQSVDQADPLVVIIPSTSFENSLNVQKSSIFYSPPSKSSVSVSVIERLSRYVNEGSDVLRHLSTSTILGSSSKRQKTSNSVHLVVQRLDDNSLEDSTVFVVLQHDQKHVYGNISGTNVTVKTFCNDTSIHKYDCPSGQVISHDCSQYKGLFLTSMCSMMQVFPSCAVVDDRSSQVRRSNCSVVSYTSQNTTCICQIPFTPTTSSSPEKSSSGNNQIDSSTAVTVMAMSEYTSRGFSDTIVESDTVSASEVRSSYLVLTMFIVLWGFGSIFLIEDFRLTGNWFVSSKPRSKRNRTGVGGPIVPLDGPIEIRKKYLVTYLDSIFPEVFRQEGSTWSGLIRELMKHHRYITLLRGRSVFSYEQRVKTLLQLLTVQTMLMFVLAVCYDLQYPSDDGQCETYKTESSCLHPSSILDSTQQKCKWVVPDVGDGSCSYLKPTLTLEVIVLISLVVATATAPFNLLVDLLFEIIRAPTADSDRLSSLISSGNTSIQRAGKRMSAVAIGASQAAMSRVNNLIPVSHPEKAAGKSRFFDNFVQDVIRDVPDSVAHRHVLASNALGQSLRGSREFRQHSSKKKSAVIPTNREIPDEADQTPYTLSLVKRKQRSTLFLSDVEPTPRVDDPKTSVETIPFTSVSPSSSPRTGKKDAQAALFESLISELCDQYNCLTGVSHREEFVRNWG
jgi:hypothetical protein